MQWIVEPKMDIVERLNTVREGMEAGLDDRPIALQIYEYKTAGMARAFMFSANSYSAHAESG